MTSKADLRTDARVASLESEVKELRGQLSLVAEQSVAQSEQLVRLISLVKQVNCRI